MRFLAALAIGLVILFPPVGARAAERVEVMVPGGDSGIMIHLIHKSPISHSSFIDGDVVLMLHPYGVPTADAFDVVSLSWMEDLVARGFDVWAMDFRGFGGSSRPEGLAPVVRATDAVRDVGAVLDYIATKRNVHHISLIGWSWGGVVAPMTAIDRPDRVGRLVMVGAMHAFPLPFMTKPLDDPAHPGQINPGLPAYQTIEPAKALGHWRMMLTGIEDIVAEATIHRIEDVIMASDRAAAMRQPAAIQRPMGPLVDLYAIWNDHPIYDAAAVRVPTLIVRGDHDVFADAGLAAKLTGAPELREVVVPRATHWLPYEAPRAMLFDNTARFFRGQ